MARRPRTVLAGLPHHVTVRGNDGQALFRDDADRAAFRDALALAADAAGLVIHGYVLLPQSIQLIATPPDATALSRAMQMLGRRYVRRFNLRHGRTGSLWEGRFRALLIEAERYLLACLRHVETQPVRSGLVEAPDAYAWSSHRHHVGAANDELVSPHALYWALGNTPFEREKAYARRFERGDTPDERAASDRILHGHPPAGADYLDALERQHGRALAPRPVGRPAARPIGRGGAGDANGRAVGNPASTGADDPTQG